MKTLIGALIFTFAGVCVNAGQALIPISTSSQAAAITANTTEPWLKKIVTQDGHVYENCRILKVEPNGILIEHTPKEGALGLAKVRFSVLPPEIQKRFNYNASEAAQFESLQAKSNAEWARQVQEQKKINAELAQESEKEAIALRLAEEKVRVEKEQLAAQRAHEEELMRESRQDSSWSYWNYPGFVVGQGRNDFHDPELVPRKPSKAVMISTPSFTARKPKAVAPDHKRRGK